MRACAFSKMRGAAPMNVGLTTARFSTILSTRPSIAVANPHANWAVIRTLPNACAIGSHINCRSSSPRKLGGRPSSPRTPKRSAATALPWGGRLFLRCRSTSPIGPVRSRRFVSAIRMDARADIRRPSSARSARVITQSPSPVPSNSTTLVRLGSSATAFGQLRQLPGVLGEHNSAFRVGEDVCGIACVGARINGRGGGPGTHDRQIGQYPLVSRAGRDADALLGFDAQRQQSGGQRLDAVRGLPPGRRDPFAGNKITESLLIRRRLDAVEKHRSHIRCGSRCGCEVAINSHTRIPDVVTLGDFSVLPNGGRKSGGRPSLVALLAPLAMACGIGEG